MKLRKKFPSLRLGDLQIRRTFSKRTKRVETFEARSLEFGVRSCFTLFSQFDRREFTRSQLPAKIIPRNVERVIGRDRLRVLVRTNGKLFRFAQNENRFTRQI